MLMLRCKGLTEPTCFLKVYVTTEDEKGRDVLRTLVSSLNSFL